MLVGITFLSTSCNKEEQDGNWAPIKFSQSKSIVMDIKEFYFRISETI